MGKLDTNMNEKWVKKMIKTQDPGPLAELIEDRIKWPANTGPYIQLHSDEKSVDIITEMVGTFPDFHDKIENAVGLILWKMLHKKMDEKSELLFGAFNLIKANKFTGCGLLVHDWLSKNVQYLKGDNKNGVELYNTALFAFGAIQIASDKSMEDYWLNMWREGRPQFWAAGFSGLRKQNPMAAVNELPLLAKRNTANMGNHLTAMLFDDACWPLLKEELKTGLVNEDEYCGLALNVLLSKLTKPEQSKVIQQLACNTAQNNQTQTPNDGNSPPS